MSSGAESVDVPVDRGVVESGALSWSVAPVGLVWWFVEVEP
jgi:hypothetical protein